MPRTFLAGGDLVLPDRILAGHTLVLDGERIVDIASGPFVAGRGDTRVDVSGALIVPGFIDGHVHGVAGTDVLDGGVAIATVADALPRWGVTAFSPTTIACAPATLDEFLVGVAAARFTRPAASARVLPAHLESNFINPEYAGAQPVSCLRAPILGAAQPRTSEPEVVRGVDEASSRHHGTSALFSAADILTVIGEHRPDVGVVTLAPELEGGLDLVRRFASTGIAVSLGHSGATFEQAQAAIAAGARRVTHLFNRMSGMTHRAPGLAGAALASAELAAELVCDGHHVHPAVMRTAIAAKGVSRVMAITDGTAGSGLPVGSRTRLGGQMITTGDVARLDNGTMAGSVLTMDRAFAMLVNACGCTLPQAAELCATTPARELGLHGHGVIAKGAVADLVVLTSQLTVRATWIGGVKVWGP